MELTASLAFAVAAGAATSVGTVAPAAIELAVYVAVPAERKDSAAETASVAGLAAEPGDVVAMLAASLVRVVVETVAFVALPGGFVAETAETAEPAAE